MGGMHVPNGLKILHVFYVIYFRGRIRQTMVVSHEILFPCGMECLQTHLIISLEENFMEGWIGDYLAHGRSLSFDGITNGGGDELQHSPYQLLEDKKHFEGEDYNIPN